MVLLAMRVAWSHLKYWTINHICHFVPFFLVSERSWQNRPLLEALCTWSRIVAYVARRVVYVFTLYQSRPTFRDPDVTRVVALTHRMSYIPIYWNS